MAATAQFVQFGPFFSGYEVNEPMYVRVYHYAAGTTTLLDCWQNRTKTSAAPQPLVADAQGICAAYFDGNYKIVVKFADSEGNETTLYTWDQYTVRPPYNVLQGSITWDPPSLADGAGATSPAITVLGANLGNVALAASATQDIVGLIATAYVSGVDAVNIRIQNETGGTVNLSSSQWNVYVMQY